MRPFKWGTTWSFILRDIRVITSQSQKFKKRPILLSKLELSEVWLLVFLMPLEIKLHAVPHLEGLINGWNISGRQDLGSTYTKKNSFENTLFYIIQSVEVCKLNSEWNKKVTVHAVFEPACSIHLSWFLLRVV